MPRKIYLLSGQLCIVRDVTFCFIQPLYLFCVVPLCSYRHVRDKTKFFQSYSNSSILHWTVTVTVYILYVIVGIRYAWMCNVQYTGPATEADNSIFWWAVHG